MSWNLDYTWILYNFNEGYIDYFEEEKMETKEPNGKCHAWLEAEVEKRDFINPT